MSPWPRRGSEGWTEAEYMGYLLIDLLVEESVELSAAGCMLAAVIAYAHALRQNPALGDLEDGAAGSPGSTGQ